MATPRGRNRPALSEQLFQEPYRFDFFQAVRLLERLGEAGTDPRSGERKPVGHDFAPSLEAVRFRALPSCSFAAAPIRALRAADSDADGPVEPPEMQVSFMGMTGPSGVLPQHYTQLVIDRVRRNDVSLRDFLDVFHHRMISLFFRAWEKYRFPFRYERAARSAAREEDLFTQGLYCLVGLGTGALRGQLEISDESFLYYSGHFAQRRPCAVSLRQWCEDCFGVRVVVQQFCGQWLYLSKQRDQSLIPLRRLPRGRNSRLGVDVVVGERVFSVQNKFRLRLGSLSYAQFRQLMPSGGRLQALCQMVRLYVGMEFDFDVQLVLRGDEVPWCSLGGDGAEAAQLGWNTWIRAAPLENDVDDAVFVDDGFPHC